MLVLTSTSSTTVSSVSASFAEASSSFTSTSASGGGSAATAAVEEFEAGQDGLAQRALDAESEVFAQEPDGTVLVAVATKASDNNTDVTVAHAGMEVTIPAALVLAAGDGGFVSLVLARLGSESQTLEALEAADAQALAGRPVSIVIFTSNGTRWSGPLPEPLELSIPLDQNTTEDGECAFWDTNTNSWSTEGVSTLSIDNRAAACQTTHLSLLLIWTW